MEQFTPGREVTLYLQYTFARLLCQMQQVFFHLLPEGLHRGEFLGTTDKSVDFKAHPMAVEVAGEAMKIDLQHLAATGKLGAKIKQARVRARVHENRANMDTRSTMIAKTAHVEVDGGETEFSTQLHAFLNFAAENFHTKILT